MTTLISDWANFYVIVGSSAAALTGLQFVVIALNMEKSVSGGDGALSAFATPTVVHFCAVLLVSSILSMPGHSGASLAVCLVMIGLIGVGYVFWITLQSVRQTAYEPVLEDWIWHTWLPLTAYAGVGGAGSAAHWHLHGSLYIVGGAVILLLFVGIHNAWDAAVWMATKPTPPRN